MRDQEPRTYITWRDYFNDQEDIFNDDDGAMDDDDVVWEDPNVVQAEQEEWEDSEDEAERERQEILHTDYNRILDFRDRFAYDPASGDIEELACARIPNYFYGWPGFVERYADWHRLLIVSDEAGTPYFMPEDQIAYRTPETENMPLPTILISPNSPLIPPSQRRRVENLW